MPAGQYLFEPGVEMQHDTSPHAVEVGGRKHVLEMFRRTLPQGPERRLLDRLANRLTKITAETRKLKQE